ncbi:MAG: type 4a pilus biogenesis protein PilO, partial [Candidatus Omnitrophota bacterium]
FDKFSKKEKLWLVIAAIFIFVAAIDRLVVSPINTRMKQLSQEIKIKEKQLARNLRNLSQKETVSKEYEKYMKYVKKIGSNEEEVARILSAIESLARKSAVYLVDIKPQAPKDIDFYREYVVEVTVEGEMESIVRFLYELNISEQLLRAEKLQINLKEKATSVIKAGIIVTQVLVP